MAYPDDLLWAKVDAGEWTVGEGLIANLKILAGEAEVADIYGDDTPVLGESEVLVRTARAYLRRGKNERVRGEIRRLLGKLLIDTARMKRESVLDTSYSQGDISLPAMQDKLAALIPPARADTDCGVIWGGDRSEPDPRTGGCVLERRWQAEDAIHRIYYPGQWRALGHERRSEEVERTKALIQTALARYRELGRMGDINIYMSVSGPGDKAWTFAGRTPDDACEIFVFQTALSPESRGYFPFFIAHELFHCFQGWNLGRSYWGVAGRGGIRHQTFIAWWVEGTANYFADTVFPDAEYELTRWPDRFDRDSPDTALVNFSYENVYFFQFLGDRLSDKQLIQRLRSLPGSGDSSAHAEALSGWGDMQTIFQQFGRAYLNDELTDVNGDQIPFDPDHGTVTVVDSSGFGALAPPFVLHRERIEFPDGKAFDVEATPGDDPPGRYAVKPQPDGDWRRFPPRVPSPCADSDEYQLLLTSATGGGGSHQLDVKLEEAGDGGAEPAQVDACLTGKWRAVPESLEDSMASMAGGVAGFERLEVEAENWVCFDAAGFIEGYADMRARWRFELPGRASQRMQSEVTIRGPFSGRYRIEGGAIELSGQSNAVTADSRIWLDGEYVGEGGTVAMPGLAGGAPAPDNQSYRCEGDRLDWTPPVPGMRPEPVVYERVSP